MTGRRTEQPTARRVREARRRGEVARSLDLSGAAALAAGLGAAAMHGSQIAGALAHALRGALATASASPLRADALLREALALVARLSIPVAAAALAGGALAGLVQTRFGFFPGVLRPRLDRVDPSRGLRRLIGPAQLARAALALAKALAVAAVLAWWWVGAARPLASLPRGSAAGALAGAVTLVTPLAVWLAIALAVLGGVELALERRRLRRALMMTRDEVRRELREDEGDPDRKAERRRVHCALAEAGPIARATVVVVNPTRVAVALRHARGEEGAPRVVAKGTGAAAARIRSIARRSGVPVVRDVPLARALHRLAEVGDEIPEELYAAAAALLAHLYVTTEEL